MQTLIGQKREQSQRFLENGKRIPVTLIDVKGNTIVALKTQEKNNYQAVQLGFSMKKKASKAELGHAKGAKLTKAPKFLKEVKIVDDSPLPEVGLVLNPAEVFEPGDMVDVSGFSKGKGFQGGVKRHGFHGGPKTHGQSDRHRAPGSIGQGTTPGRVYKGKRMAGNMGNDNVTIKNLEVIDLTDDGVLIVKGLVPGIMNGPLMVTKTGTDKNFVPLWRDKTEEEGESSQTLTTGDAQTVEEESVTKDPSSLSGNQPTDTEEESKSAEGPVSDSPQKDSPDVALENVSSSESETSNKKIDEEAKVDASETETKKAEDAGKNDAEEVQEEQKVEAKEEGETADAKAEVVKEDAK